MTRQLTAHSSLETLRKEAKRWLKALGAHDLEAHERLRRSHPGAPLQPGLRDIRATAARRFPRSRGSRGTVARPRLWWLAKKRTWPGDGAALMISLSNHP